ncbi:F-box only protein [Skeletonema marinoi]|uniref:F-box only protein n=1 Tax=Skeletonema marinoi TaxID=267567 RepID=A0AAD8YIP0_9STRA|nr:F-box only protein [Skeletonema marinoi]
MYWLSTLAALIVSSLVGIDAFAANQQSTRTASCLSMAQDAVDTKITTLTDATNWRLRLLLNGVTTTQGRKIDGQLFVLNGNFIEEEGYEPPQGLFTSLTSSNKSEDGSDEVLSLEISSSRWKLSEDPDDPKDGLWIWGLFKEPLYPFMLLQMETKELELSSAEGEEKDSIPALKLYAQINHIRDQETGNVDLKTADVNIRLLEQIQLPGATVDLYENEKVGQVSFQPLSNSRASGREWHSNTNLTQHSTMVSRERDEALPAIPENSESKLRSASLLIGDDEEDADDQEQRLYEADNIQADEEEPKTGDNNETTLTTSHTSDEDGNRFYVQSATGGQWELTWPIWHLLPRNERREIATQYGMKTIGDFEEYMSLTRAVDESEGIIGTARSGVIVSSAADMRDRTDAAESNYLEIIERGGLPCTLPDEILRKCFAFLPIDDHANLALVSPHWSKFTRCEELYKSLCQRIYLNQSKRKVLHVHKFGNSYRRMLELRPRIRVGGGLYVLQYKEVKKIQRDMWTDIPVGAVLESIYYRYLYFFEDGRVMYALTHAHPMEMIPRFHNMILRGYGSKDKWGVWGKYQIKKDIVRVWATQQWHDVCFQMRVLPSNKVLNYDNGDRGVCTSMQLDKHMSSASGNFEEDNRYDLVTYEVPPHLYFRFLRDRRL